MEVTNNIQRIWTQLVPVLVLGWCQRWSCDLLIQKLSLLKMALILFAIVITTVLGVFKKQLIGHRCANGQYRHVPDDIYGENSSHQYL